MRISVMILILLCTALAPASTPSADQAAASGSSRTGPNELGKVPILEYHLIQPEETRWGRSAENFRQDLESLYRRGYRPVGMNEYVSGRMLLPDGTRPFILTFDDSSPGQFRYVFRGGRREIDPDCAVGMLAAFHRKHPDFALKGIFFVLTGAEQPHKLFGQPEYEGDKLRELVSLGFEIGNHTQWHANLSKYDAQVVRKQLALPVKEVAEIVPGYVLKALALPFGMYPGDINLAVQGTYNGARYSNEAILRVTGGPALSPFSRSRDLRRLPRVQVTGRELERMNKFFELHPEQVYISDGKDDTVSFPRALASEANSTGFPSLRYMPY